jgi:outer membrane protein assembly factor BamB
MHLRNNIFTLSLLALLALSACSLPWKKEVAPKKDETSRIEALKMDNQLVADASLANTPPVLPPAESFPNTLEVHDSVSVGEGQDFIYNVTPPPAVGDGVVYAMDAAGTVSAHDAQDISRVSWQIKGVADEDETTLLTGGLTYAAGVVYVASGNGLVAAFEAKTGRELWRQDIKIPVRSSPRVEGGQVFIVTIDSQIFALNATTGASMWTTRGISEGSSFLALASPTIANGMVVAPFSSGELRVLQAADGVGVWSDMVSAGKRLLATANFGGFGGDPVVTGNALYVTSTSGVLAAYRLDNGLRVWEQPVASSQKPLVIGNAVFVLSSDASLIALNRLDGRVFWISTLPRYENTKERKDPYHWSGPVIAGDKLYVAGAHGEMKMFNPSTGADMGTIEIPEDVYTAPVVAGNRMLLLRKNAELVTMY